jgi:Esterase PHB depolymerase
LYLESGLSFKESGASNRNRFRNEGVMRIGLLPKTLAALTCAAAAAAQPTADAPEALRAYNAPVSESSISGVSSGGYMAVQFGTAWSSVIRGVGIVAGGPYWCAKADGYDFVTWYWGPIFRATGSCMKGPASKLNVTDFTAKANAKASSGDIDPVQNLSRQKVYLFHGYNDKFVARAATDAAADFHRHYLGAANRGNLFYQTTLGAGHSLVVLSKPGVNGLNRCNDNDSPYIGQCNYDQAGVILQHIYGALNAPNRGQLTGTVREFDQSIYAKPDTPISLSLADTGYVFVPKDCDDGIVCRVHVVLHGCRQNAAEIGRRFIDDTGFNAWADTNRMIVLYPQTRSSAAANPLACWDWWSYVNHSDSYVTKSGPQIRAIKAMLNALTAGAVPVAAAPAASSALPSGLAVIDTTDTSVALAWKAVEGVTTYRVWRADDARPFAAVADVTGPSFGDSGLAAKASYRWRVSAIVNGAEGPPSNEVVATTRSTPAPCNNPGTCPIGQ